MRLKLTTIGYCFDLLRLFVCFFLSFFLEWYTYISNSSSGYITSPYYPALYLNNMERIWEIEVQDDQQIELDWLFLNIKDYMYNRCENDSVHIVDTHTYYIHETFCGYILPSQHVTTTNKVTVIFQSGKGNVGTGFKLRYQAVQGKFLREHYKTEHINN